MEINCPECNEGWSDEGGQGRVTYYQCPKCGAVFSIESAVQIKLPVFQ